MIIDLRTITQDTRRFEFSLDRNWWNSAEHSDPIQVLDTPLQVAVEIYKVGERYALNGEINGGLRLICDRCLEPYHRDIRSVFKVILALPLADSAKTDVELAEKDMEVGFISDDEIDLREIIREQVYLAIPMKSLCREDCLGLCPGCGTNLNMDDCQCHRTPGHPGFLKLKRLTKKGE